MDYKEIIRDVAKRKLIDLAKVCLDIIDELKKEDAAQVEKILAIVKRQNCEENIQTLRPFLYLLDDNKKEIIRKRILDKTNELARELEQ